MSRHIAASRHSFGSRRTTLTPRRAIIFEERRRQLLRADADGEFIERRNAHYARAISSASKQHIMPRAGDIADIVCCCLYMLIFHSQLLRPAFMSRRMFITPFHERR